MLPSASWCLLVPSSAQVPPGAYWDLVVPLVQLLVVLQLLLYIATNYPGAWCKHFKTVKICKYPDFFTMTAPDILIERQA